MMHHSRMAFGLIAACSLGCATPQAEPPQTAPATPPSAESGEPETTEPPPDESVPNDAASTLFIHEASVACQGEGTRRCMQVRASESEEWTWFYDKIEGFDREEGVRYELRVEISEVENPPADGSSRRYRLVEVVSKKKVEPDPD